MTTVTSCEPEPRCDLYPEMWREEGTIMGDFYISLEHGLLT